MLVVGPNRVFLDYIANVLPSLGERSVQQRTIGDLAVPRVEVTAEDSVAAARVKGAAVMATVIERAALAQLTAPAEPVREPLGATAVVVEPAEIERWIDAALAGNQPLNRRREAVRAVAEQALRRRTGRDEIWSLVPTIPARWPGLAGRAAPTAGRAAAVAPRGAGRRGRRAADRRRAGPGPHRPWSRQAVDAGRPGAPRHRNLVPQRSARDLRPRRGGRSAGPVRAGAGRRRPALPPRLVTILGDLAQSTGAAGQSSWADVIRFLGADPSTAVEHLTIGYRVPAPILDVANRLLPATGVDVPASRSVRREGHAPAVLHADDPALGAAEEVVALRRHHALTGVIAPERWLAPIADALPPWVWRRSGTCRDSRRTRSRSSATSWSRAGARRCRRGQPGGGARRHGARCPPGLRRADPGGAGATIVSAGALPEMLGLGLADHDERDIAPVR